MLGRRVQVTCGPLSPTHTLSRLSVSEVKIEASGVIRDKKLKAADKAGKVTTEKEKGKIADRIKLYSFQNKFIHY